MTGKSKAIETSYKGYKFRSRLEARWAVFFDSMKIQWDYEIEGFRLPGDVWYLPDFLLHLPQGDVWAEIKPAQADDFPDLVQTRLSPLCRATGNPVVLLNGAPAFDRAYAAVADLWSPPEETGLNVECVTPVFFSDHCPQTWNPSTGKPPLYVIDQNGKWWPMIEGYLSFRNQRSSRTDLHFNLPSIRLVTEYWGSLLDGGDCYCLKFSGFDDRRAKHAFGRLFMESVTAARSARFEHGKAPTAVK
jgi:hypothetical protein